MDKRKDPSQFSFLISMNDTISSIKIEGDYDRQLSAAMVSGLLRKTAQLIEDHEASDQSGEGFTETFLKKLVVHVKALGYLSDAHDSPASFEAGVSLITGKSDS